MSNVYSSQLLFVSDGGSVEEVTVPGDVVWVVRDIVTTVKTGSDGDSLDLLNTGAVLYIHTFVASDVQSLIQHWVGHQVVKPGQTLTFEPQAGTWDVLVSGYSLSLP